MSPVDEAARAARAGQETLEASAEVIARRLAIMAEAARDPARADLAELTLMGTEKVAAMGRAAEAGMRGAAVLMGEAEAVARRETDAARTALDAAIAARNPAELAVAQTAYASGLMGRAAADAWRLGAVWMKLGGEAFAPIRDAATANAERLKKG